MNDQNKNNDIIYDKSMIFNGELTCIALNKGEKALTLTWEKSLLVFPQFLGINHTKHQSNK